ncbi:hypothetical protein HZ326_9393 [Fusarium oxysporum f. sp. albedinis]|nr:hypothetical protein HZ326_9393 [Fusarium oxysporum f. sp. albedinis]
MSSIKKNFGTRKPSLSKPMSRTFTAPAESAVCIGLALWVSAAQYRHVKGLESSRSNFYQNLESFGLFPSSHF